MVKMNMKSKFEAQTLDMVEAAQECCDAYQEVLACGADMEELHTVMSNIQFVKDTIQANGVQWYIDNCDPENQFAHLYGCTGKLKDAWMQKADAAMEGVFTTIWNKIREWWKKFVDWIKSIFTNGEKKAKDNLDEANAAKKEADSASSEEKSKAKSTFKDTVLKVTGLKAAGRAGKKLWNKIKGKKGSQEALGDAEVSAIEGEMPTLEGLELMARVTPNVLRDMRTGFSKFESLLNDMKHCKTSEDFEKIADAVTKEADIHEKYAAEQYGPIEGKMVKASSNGKVTFASIGVNSDSEVDSYTSGLAFIVGTIREMETMMRDVASKAQGIVSSMNADKLDGETHPAAAHALREFNTYMSEASGMLSGMREMCIALTECAKEMQQAKLANIKNAA